MKNIHISDNYFYHCLYESKTKQTSKFCINVRNFIRIQKNQYIYLQHDIIKREFHKISSSFVRNLASYPYIPKNSQLLRKYLDVSRRSPLI